jgi:hypothetical protein
MNPTTVPDRSAELEKATEVRRLRRLLKDIADLAQHASLTGSLQGGVRTATRRYNTVIARLETLNITSPGLFTALGDDTTFDELGVEASLLAGYLKEDEQAADERSGNKSGNNSAPFINIVGDLGSLHGLEELKDLGKQIRESLPEWMRNRSAPPGLPEEAPTPPTPPAPPTPPTGRAGDVPQPMPDLSGINR